MQKGKENGVKPHATQFDLRDNVLGAIRGPKNRRKQGIELNRQAWEWEGRGYPVKGEKKKQGGVAQHSNRGRKKEVPKV